MPRLVLPLHTVSSLIHGELLTHFAGLVDIVAGAERIDATQAKGRSDRSRRLSGEGAHSGMVDVILMRHQRVSTSLRASSYGRARLLLVSFCTL